jgi:hypothetical protein
MAGIYTQQRALLTVGNLSNWWEKTPSGVTVNSGAMSIASDQVTTSFRTGRGESLVSPGELSDNNNYLNNLLSTKEVTYDTGHEFSTVKRQAFVNFPSFTTTSADGSVFHNPFVTDAMSGVAASSFPKVPKWATSSSDGNQAIEATYPTRPGVSLAQTVAELKREGLPSLFGSQIASMKGSAARAIGGEFLNSAFGWTPLIADLDKLLKSVVSSSQTIQQLQRDSGRLVRRKYHFPSTRTLVSSTAGTALSRYFSTVENPSGGKIGNLTVEETLSTKMWFSGAYTYFLDPGEDLIGKAVMYEQLANKLLGLRLTPATLWELAPWSWLADWYANIGNNITVASAFQSDGLTLKYGYLMRQVTAERLYTFTPRPGSNPAFQGSSLLLRTTSKERVKSSPFGFGISTAQFTGRQWAIAAALGLTKAPRSLH